MLRLMLIDWNIKKQAVHKRNRPALNYSLTLSISLYRILITVGAVSASTITNKTSGSASVLIAETSKNPGQKKKHAHVAVNIKTNKVVVSPLNGLQSL